MTHAGAFRLQCVDGKILLNVNDNFLRNVLNISNSIQRRKIIRQIDELVKNKKDAAKSRTLDELDEYVMYLETHRLKVRISICTTDLL